MLALAVFGALALNSGGEDGCHLPSWPSTAEVATWPFKGLRERCFCAYAAHTLDYRLLDAGCPSWRHWVSTDRVTPNRVSHHDRATVLAGVAGNASASRYAFVGDWAVDLGSGYGEDCNRGHSAECLAIGAHVLSVPRQRYLRQCCVEGQASLGSLLRSDPRELCGTLFDLIEGVRLSSPSSSGTQQCAAHFSPRSFPTPRMQGLSRVPELEIYDSCRQEGQEPTVDNGCLAQCFHIVPDVFFLHLHTTAGVRGIQMQCAYDNITISERLPVLIRTSERLLIYLLTIHYSTRTCARLDVS